MLIRQGDLLMVGAVLSAGLRRVADGIVARGEATGHAHRLEEGTLWIDEAGAMWIAPDAETGAWALVHEEHARQTGRAPCRVVRQREYHETSPRQVVD